MKNEREKIWMLLRYECFLRISGNGFNIYKLAYAMRSKFSSIS